MNHLPLMYYRGSLMELPPGQNILTPWPMVRNIVLEGESLEIPTYFNLTIPGEFTILGDLSIQLDGGVYIP